MKPDLYNSKNTNYEKSKTGFTNSADFNNPTKRDNSEEKQ